MFMPQSSPSLPSPLSGIHHVASCCRNAKEAVVFYERVMGMKYVSAFSEDNVPSTCEHAPICSLVTRLVFKCATPKATQSSAIPSRSIVQ